MASIHSEDTRPEQAARRELRRRGYRNASRVLSDAAEPTPNVESMAVRPACSYQFTLMLSAMVRSGQLLMAVASIQARERLV